jgi:hypothetical protein
MVDNPAQTNPDSRTMHVRYVDNTGPVATNGETESLVVAQYSQYSSGDCVVEIFSNYFNLPTIWDDLASRTDSNLFSRGLSTRESTLIHEVLSLYLFTRLQGCIANTICSSLIGLVIGEFGVLLSNQATNSLFVSLAHVKIFSSNYTYSVIPVLT